MNLVGCKVYVVSIVVILRVIFNGFWGIVLSGICVYGILFIFREGGYRGKVVGVGREARLFLCFFGKLRVFMGRVFSIMV